MCPRTTLPSHRPCSGTGSCRRCLSWSLTSFSFARIRFEMVIRLTWKRPARVFPQMCVKPREIERLRLPGAPLLPVRGGEPPELDQPRLARVQLQGEPREPLAEIPQELPGVSQMLEPGDEVVGETHDDHVAARVPPPPPLGPQVKDIVEVDVRQQRGYRCPLRRALRGL